MQEKLLKKKQLKLASKTDRDPNMSFACDNLYKPDMGSEKDTKKISDSATFPNNITPQQNNVYLPLQP